MNYVEGGYNNFSWKIELSFFLSFSCLFVTSKEFGNDTYSFESKFIQLIKNIKTSRI